ncbi:MAG: BsaA family SipW-dependent biofilm matrix protein [Bacilli bacterium]|nr:BsaA family SipW-dependent biofilm matrix protein [Bacilli bacterium]
MKKLNNKEEKDKEKKNKKKTFIVAGISVLTILSGTLAYFTTSTNFKNDFKSGLYQANVVETFVAPTNWTPGDTTAKEIKVTNNGSITMAVRAKYTEKWTSKDGTNLSLKDSNNNVASIINFNTGWTKDSDGYYYYGSKSSLTKLEPNQTSTSFISGVTFNSNIVADIKETKSADGKTVTYTSTGKGYDNATYTLTITIDTVQYNQAINVWN